jgi:integrase
MRSIKSNLIFYSKVGEEFDGRNILSTFYIAVEKAEIAHCRFHGLRHTFVTRPVQAGVLTFTKFRGC